MKTVLVTGANGFVGRALCAELLKRKYSVRSVVRASSSWNGDACEIVRVSGIDRATEWADAMKGIETVIHLAARMHVMSDTAADPLAEFRHVNTAGTKHLARCAAANGVRRMVYVSSIKVNGKATHGDRKYTETDAPAPQDSYGASKLEAEQALLRVAGETGLEVVIVRPPLIYGPGVKGNFAQMLGAVAKGAPLPFASAHNRRSLIYVGNLVDALIACATHPAAAGQTYLVCDGEDISTPDLLRRLAAAMNVPARLFRCPPALLQLAGKLAGKSQKLERLLGSLQVDGGKIRRDLNWTPPCSLQQGLQATAEWYLANGHGGL